MSKTKKWFKCDSCGNSTFRTKDVLAPRDYKCPKCKKENGLKPTGPPEERSQEERDCFKKCIDIYNEFMLREYSISADINAGDCQAMYEVIDFLKRQNGGQPLERVIEGWDILLSADAFKFWDEFYQKNIKLKQIRHNLINIISNVKINYKKATANRINSGTDYSEFRESLSGK